MEHTWELKRDGSIDKEAWFSGDDAHAGPYCKACCFRFCLECALDARRDYLNQKHYPCPGKPLDGTFWWWKGSEVLPNMTPDGLILQRNQNVNIEELVKLLKERFGYV